MCRERIGSTTVAVRKARRVFPDAANEQRPGITRPVQSRAARPRLWVGGSRVEGVRRAIGRPRNEAGVGFFGEGGQVIDHEIRGFVAIC